MIASNLAVELALLTQGNVVLVDLDYRFGQVATLLDVEPTYTLADLCATPEQLEPAVLTRALVKHATGVKVLSRPASFAQAETMTAASCVGLLTTLLQLHAFVVTDGPHRSDPAAQAVLNLADYNLLTLQLLTNASLQSFLAVRGYSAAEVSAIMNRQYDANGAYPFRVATALGLAYWNSGIPGGLWQTRGAPAGNNNTWIGSSEIEWTETVLSQSLAASDDIWLDYINNYVRGTSSEMYTANANLRYRYGVKTFVNYLMERRESHSETPELADARTQPMQAVKDAVTYMTQYIDSLDTDDKLSLEIYGTTARHEVDLTRTYSEVSGRLHDMQAGHYDGWTNVGGGIQRAIEELTSSRSRSTATKMIILLTDGNANVNEAGGVDDIEGGNAYALNRAQAAADQGIFIFAVSVGAESNPSLMQQIADLGHGEHFHAEGSIEEYSAQLAEIFIRLGGTRPVELIR